MSLIDLLSAHVHNVPRGSEQPPHQEAGEDQPGTQGKGWLQQIFFSASVCSFSSLMSVFPCMEANV